MSRINTRTVWGACLAILLCFVPAVAVLPGIDILFWFLFKPADFWQKFAFSIVAIACFWPQVLFASFLFYIVADVIDVD